MRWVASEGIFMVRLVIVVASMTGQRRMRDHFRTGSRRR